MPGDRAYVRFLTTRNQGEETGNDDPTPKHPQFLPGSPVVIVSGDDVSVQGGVRLQVAGNCERNRERRNARRRNLNDKLLDVCWQRLENRRTGFQR